MRYEFGGMSTNTDTDVVVLDEFDLVYDDDDQFYLSKKVFRHEEEDFEFDYKYAIIVTNMAEATGEDLPLIVELVMLVSPDSLHESIRKKVYDENWTQSELGDWKYKDISDYGLAIRLGNVNVSYDEDIAYEDNEELQHTLKSITVVYQTIDRMRGFYLDRYVNRIGTTGWDIIKECVEGKDSIQTTLDRYK